MLLESIFWTKAGEKKKGKEKKKKQPHRDHAHWPAEKEHDKKAILNVGDFFYDSIA